MTGPVPGDTADSRYRAAVAALEQAERFGIHPSLVGIRALTEVLGRPQEAFRVVQVTGTNGKTSVVRMTAALLEAHGLRAGSYTSPHLIDYTERIEIEGAPLSPGGFAVALGAALDAAERVRAAQADALGLGDAVAEPSAAFTEFELLTAAALHALRERGVDWAVLEVGMGGRWDATSVAQPAVAVVTGVALDHTRHLGETVSIIAEDKSFVIKAGARAVLGPGTEGVDGILSARAAAVGADVIRVREGMDPDPTGSGGAVSYVVTGRPTSPRGGTELSVSGAYGSYELTLAAPAYQAANAAVSVAAAEAALGRALDPERTREALGALRFPGRFDVLRQSPYLIADGAHNPEAASVLASALADAFPISAPACVLAVLEDKDARGIVASLRDHVGRFFVTETKNARALSAAVLAKLVATATGEVPVVVSSVAEAIAMALSEGDVVATGSLTTAGEALVWAGRS